MFIGMGMPIPDLANLPGSSRPGGGGGGAFEYTAIANSFSMEFDGASATKFTFETPTPNLQRGVNSPVSISCWVKPDSQSYVHPSYWHSFVCNITGSTGQPGWGLSKGYGGLGTSKIAVRLNQQSATNSSGGGYGNTNLLDNNWHHILFTMEDAGSPESGVFLNRCKIYVDGQRENYHNTTTPMEMIIVNNTPAAPSSTNYYLEPVLTIGNNTNFQGTGDAFYYDGLADEVAIWNTVLSEDTIQAIYDITANNPGKVANLSETPEGAPAAWYRMGD